MKVARIILSLGFLLVLTSGAQAQKVRVDWDKTASFTGFRTYAWGDNTRATNPLMDQRIVEGLEAQLAAKGLRKVDPEDNPDLVVTYHVATEMETQLNTINTGFWGPGWGYGWRGGMGMAMGPGMATTTVEKIPVGQLIVDIGDVKNRKFIWRGTATGTLSSKPEKVTKMINKSLTKMFEKFPPRA